MKATLALLALILFATVFDTSAWFGQTRNILTDTVIIKEVGALKFITTYRDEMKYGPEITLLPNGDTLRISYYKEDMLDGKTCLYYEGNRLARVEYYKDDYKTGEWQQFDTLGQLTTIIHFKGNFHHLDPRWSGEELYYHKGKLAYIQVWDDGRRSEVILKDKQSYQLMTAGEKVFGNKVFEEACASCHAIDKAIIGPALQRVVELHSNDWLVGFTRNADSLVKAGDKAALEVYVKYHNQSHPDFTYLTKGDVEKVIGYIRGQ